MSCGQKSRHVNVRYFFVKDIIKQNQISVEYCPTDLMVADFFTKPLQGGLFRKFKAVIMGHMPMSSLQRPVSKDHVGNNICEQTQQQLMTEEKLTEERTAQKPTVAWADVVRR